MESDIYNAVSGGGIWQTSVLWPKMKTKCFKTVNLFKIKILNYSNVKYIFSKILPGLENINGNVYNIENDGSPKICSR